MKPIIGITPSFIKGRYDTGPTYVKKITGQGAVPIILPYDMDSIPVYLKMVSGFLFTGGGDIESARFNQEHHEKSSVPVKERDNFELELCRLAVEADIPLLGICRGAQILNVALGGDINQHIEEHNYGGEERANYIHYVKVVPGSKLHWATGSIGFRVNSVHHQCVGEKLGKGVSVCATSPDDGIIESIEVESKKFALGVQWHPEELADEQSEELFREFISAAKSYEILRA